MRDWFEYHVSIKRILGNHSNDMSLIACLLAKEYLSSKLPMEPFDAAENRQGAAGLDIDESTTDGQRVIGEIKTTIPYQKNDLGAAQKRTFGKDFDKLNRHTATHKFFFVTNERTFGLMRDKYAGQISGVTIVCLLTGETFIAS